VKLDSFLLKCFFAEGLGFLDALFCTLSRNNTVKQTVYMYFGSDLTREVALAACVPLEERFKSLD
jgi:hypothetical protein